MQQQRPRDYGAPSRKVEFNVGGTLYPTTVTTIRASGRLTYLAEDQLIGGPIFIDRDGPLFRYILFYLRTGQLFDLDIPNLKALKEEAKFYELSQLECKIDRMLANKRSHPEDQWKKL